ncbi:hypothetical protein N7474_007573 [Penicillium riverlandense]|uniref:uncharacterized protein n=1 Tax=Penicillium riverlandense TaxID=1903569 RepID=UPI002548C8F1|nr:uncharacterized protein N7474_007573 [Penicillium riverlandense]KAJ5811272.1 hypothetical protein N7474_007573 [Penicillium riverlandense]
MIVTPYHRDCPPLEELSHVIEHGLRQNFGFARAEAVQCPDLRQRPFGLAAPGLSGNPCIGDIGGRQNLFPTPNLQAKYSLLSLADKMRMSPSQGFIIGAGAAPFQDIGQNAELAPNISWEHKNGFSPNLDDPASLTVTNGTRVVEVARDLSGNPDIRCGKTSSTNCALMMNLYGSDGTTGAVIKVIAKARTGPQNFTDCIRSSLRNAYGDSRAISLGGVFLLKSGSANFHVMPDFPAPDQLPFRDRKQMEEEWLKYHVCTAPVVCLTVLHSADPDNLELRMEHTHCFEVDGNSKGGHYHYDVDCGEDVEYEAYLNVAPVVYRIDRP